MTASHAAIATAAESASARRALAVGVIGAGRLGSALAGALAAAGYTDLRIATRDPASPTEARTRAVAAALGVEESSSAALVAGSALVFLAVPDRAIAGLAGELTWRAGQGAVHCSGALGLDVLAAAAARGAIAGCLHPLQTFPGPPDATAGAGLFRGIVCGVEGAAPLGELLVAIAHDLGARSLRLDGVDRALYHAAAVLVSNDVAALMAAATRAWVLAGLPEDAARDALSPLLLAAAANSAAANGAHLPLAQALTGPIARGDATTVERHLRALAAPGGDADLAHLYRALARELLRLDLGHAPEVAAALEVVLREG